MAGKSSASKTGHSGSRKRRKTSGKSGFRIAAVILLGVLVLVCLPYLVIFHSGDRGAVLPAGARHLGIDISHYQGRIAWDSLKVMTDAGGKTVRDTKLAAKTYPVEFVFIKATEGESMTDQRFREYWQAAGESGIARGAYHFFRSSKSPSAQAQNFISTVGDLSADDLPPVLDIESMHRGCTKEQLNSNVLAWLKIVGEHYGRKPIVYASDNYLRDVLSSEVKEYPVWVAHYRTPSPVFQNWHYWQFSDEAFVYGVSGKVDISVKR